MTSRVWASMLPAIVLSSVALCLAGCRRQKTETTADAARPARAYAQAAGLLARYLPESPPKPANLQLGTTLRILAPPGYLDRYDPVDLRRERIPGDVQLYVRDDRSGYTPVSRAAARKTPPGQEIFARRRAPGIDRFEEDYGIPVTLVHYSEEEMGITGVGAARAQEFDLVFGPRGLLPVLLDENQLAPFTVAALTRFAPARIYIEETLGHLPEDTDLDFCIPYFRSSIGIGRNAQLVATLPRTWADGFEFEESELNWHRVLLRRDPFVLFSAAILYQRSLPPQKLQSSRQANRRLLEQVAALAASAESAGAKSAALQRLRKEYAAAAKTAEQVDGSAFILHTASFTAGGPDGPAAKPDRSFAATAIEDSRLDSDDAVLAAADLLKRLLVFGADFYDERIDHARLMTSDWAYLIGASGRPFVQVAHDPRYGFSLPAPKGPVELDVFVLPVTRDELSRRTAQFFVNYLLIPEVAASMTTFGHRATLVRESLAFLSAEIINSPIYSQPEPHSIVYLPILAGNEDRLRRVWDDILTFRDSIKTMEDPDDARRIKPAVVK